MCTATLQLYRRRGWQSQGRALPAAHQLGVLLAVLPSPLQLPALPPRQWLAQQPGSNGRHVGRRRMLRRALLGRHRRHAAQVRHDVDQGAPLLHGAPEGAPRGLPRPPVQHPWSSRVHQVSRVPDLHEEQDPGPRRAPRPKAFRHARPIRVAAEVGRVVGLQVQDRVRVPRPQGHPHLALELRQQVQGQGRAGAALGPGRRRLLLRRRVAVRAVLGACPRVLEGAPGEHGAGALLQVRRDESRPGDARAKAGGVCRVPVQRGGGGRRRGGRHCQAVLVRAHDRARNDQGRQDGARIRRCGE